MKIRNKKKYLIYGLLSCAIVVSVISFNLNDSNVNSEINDTNSTIVVNDMEQKYENHDGDILVDSLSISSIPMEDISSNNNITTVSSLTVTSDELDELDDVYFSEARATVNMDRNQIISMLTEIIEESTSNTEKENAAQQKLKLIDYMEKEKVIESLLTTKGFGDSFVLITDNAVNATVKAEKLTQQDVAKILDIIMRETGICAEKIIIQSKF